MNAIEVEIKTLNDRYFNTIKRILNKNSYLFTKFVEATPTQDKEEGFDGIFTFPDVKIPIRIRKNEYLSFRDITIRSKTRYGNRTEIHKIKEGMGDFYFYGWENITHTGIYCYTIFDLKKFVSSGIINSPDSTNIPNSDGSCFNAYKLDKLIKNDITLLYEKL